ncbi:type IX secretion system sortase PorU [Mangrovibacterium sp.]|uniref:type IX secretion system sortase PorU n=1 Tax=Mangrovibacterium sp. TaxID=1961364 RepID=UPI00356937BA
MRKTLHLIILLSLSVNLYGIPSALMRLPILTQQATEDDNVLAVEETAQIPSGAAQAVQLSAAEWASSSVLATGNWVKIKSTTRGIYQISYNTLRSWGFSDPSKVRLYGSGGYMLSKLNDEPFMDDLQQNPVWLGKNSNNADCLFFYAGGTIRWSYYSSVGAFKHEGNDYSDESYYYLSDQGEPLFIESIPVETTEHGTDVYSFLDYQLYETNLENLIQSGRRWFGDRFQPAQSREYSFTVANPLASQPISVYTETAGRSSLSSSFSVYLNNSLKGTVTMAAVSTGDPIAQYASVGQQRISIADNQTTYNFRFTYNATNSSAIGWLDYIELNVQRELKMVGSVMNFRDPASVETGTVSRFNLSNVTSDLQVWDVTDNLSPRAVSFSQQSDLVQFTLGTDLLREFVAFYPKGTIPEATKVEDVANQNLHQMEIPEMIIISHPDFWESASELAAFHEESDLMDVEVIEPGKIYNEFSSGIPDVAGIRNFLRFCYDKSNAGSGQLKYLLFFGDGSYDNQNILGEGLNFIPTYQSENSLLPTSSFVSDDFFVLLDSGEGEYSGLIDLGVGRIPANTVEDAQIAVDKIKQYRSTDALGEWRNDICFIADDEDVNTHMSQADQLADIVAAEMQAVNTSKIYFDAYTEESSPSGDQYPDVTAAINSKVKDGTLILNYTGHANELALAEEKVLGVQDIESWVNYSKLPVFVTATCEFSRFDSDEKSGGEHILFNPNGGGIALFSTTRVVYSNPNFVLNSEFYNQLFQRDADGNYLRMGDVMKRTKNAVNTGINKRNFMFLGDPALKLAIPQYEVVTRTINGVDPSALVEPIGALSKVTITGEVVDADGNRMADFNGELIPVVYDKEVQTKTIGNGGETPFEYKIRNNRIYRGVSSVTNGQFEFSFIVPKDISYAVGSGKIIYYASNGSIDAHGANSSFQIGGNSGNVSSDVQGPSIELYLNQPSFQEGDQVGVNSILYLKLSDESGINTLSTGIGHDITAVLDGDNSNVIVLNDYYLADQDSYTTGTVVYPFTNLSVGEHSLTVKVWDVLNNSTEVTVSFVVTEEFLIEDVVCYPNPMDDFSRFKIIHNRPDDVVDGRIEFFDSNGRLLDIIEQKIFSNGNETEPILWQVTDRQVLVRSGTCVYRVVLTGTDGASASKSGVLIILRR